MNKFETLAGVHTHTHTHTHTSRILKEEKRVDNIYSKFDVYKISLKNRFLFR